MQAGQLDGVQVLDLGLWRPVPYATQLLAELGATVIKVEPRGGDPMRAFPVLYRQLNARKRILEADLKDEGDRARVLDLAERADVVIEGFRPGVADRLGVGSDRVRARNPTVVYCSLSGFGQDGTLATGAGHDLNYQAWSGVLASRQPEMHRPGIPVADLAAGTFAALAVCAALRGRDRHGAGEHIDVSMADVLFSWAGPEAGGDLASSDDPGRGFPAYGTFACGDGKHLTLGIVTEDGFWRSLCLALDLGDLTDLDASQRADQGPALRARLEAAMATRSRDDLVTELLSAGVPVAPVLTWDEASAHRLFVERGVAPAAPDAAAGSPGRLVGHPVRFGERPVPPADDADPPMLGPDETFT